MVAVVIWKMAARAFPVGKLEWLIGDAGELHGLLRKWGRKNAPRISPRGDGMEMAK